MNNLKRRPTTQQTREAIEKMVIKKPYNKHYRMALKYLYIIAGRISEVYGQYSPMGKDVFIHTINGKDALIFLVKTARRSGLYRSIAVPLNEEKWALDLYSFFRDHKHRNPFDIGKDTMSSRRYLQWDAEALFDYYGHEISRDPYRRLMPKPASDRVRGKKIENGKTMYLIEYDDGARKWHDEMIMKIPKTVDEEPKPFRIMHLRGQREKELQKRYGFTNEQANTYLGIKKDTRITNLIKYDGVEPIEGKILEDILKRVETYFHQYFV